jgi:lambda repressor-like predicted transcriptional regulator
VDLDGAVSALQRAEADMPRARERAQQKAREIIAAAQRRVDTARAQLAEVIVAEYERGERVTDLARRAGYTRETIRRILRAAGVEPG